MASVLKYIGKGQWQKVDEKEIIPADKTKKINKKKLSEKEKIELFFEGLLKDVEKSGFRSTKINTILKGFGYGKRSAKNAEAIKEELKRHGLFTLPEYSNQLKLESTIRISTYPVRQLGELFGKEKDLEDFVEKNELYKKLKIKSVIRQHSPLGSKDRLDFKGHSEAEEVVVIELKNGGGGKSAVEQVLRYSGLLQTEFPASKIRQILVTGVQNYETALAIRGMNQEQRDGFEWYLYKFHRADNYFDFVRVTDEEIFMQTKTN